MIPLVLTVLISSPQDSLPTLTAPFDKPEVETCVNSWASALQVDPRITNSIGMELTLIPPGKFMMGSKFRPKELAEIYAGTEQEFFLAEYPQHQVHITKPFYVGVHEVTIGQFREFVNATGYKTQAETDGLGGSGYESATKTFKSHLDFSWRDTGFEQSKNFPVVNVSWTDCQQFVAWLSEEENREYRLLTEAEWEYCCRAGSPDEFHIGNRLSELVRAANISDRSARKEWGLSMADEFFAKEVDGHPFTAPVGSFVPNAFGLHDMHGNVAEWCSDWYDAEYYDKSVSRDPTGPKSGIFRVVRGGHWAGQRWRCRSSLRMENNEGNRNDTLGFRIAVSLPLSR